MQTLVRDSTSNVQVGRTRRFWRGQTSLLIAASVVAACIILVGVIAVTGGSDNPRPVTAAPQSGIGTNTATDTDQSIPTVPFPVTWKVIPQAGIPVPDGGARYGPTIDGIRGFAHTPRGAVLAALTVSYYDIFAPNWQESMDQSVLPGPGRDVLRSYRQQSTGPLVIPSGGFEITAGFRVVTYDPSAAVVSIASRRDPNDTIQVCTNTVRWSGNDWKQELQTDGSDCPYTSAVPDLNGFVPFWPPS